MISVALATYNGEEFLPRQLESLLAQSRLPDEIVIVDDGSRDGTVAILQEFRVNSQVPVKLFLTGENSGVLAAFQQALEFCEGDIIALCDQDDLWLPNKLRTLEVALSHNGQAPFAFSNANLIKGNDSFYPVALWDEKSLDSVARERIAKGDGFELMLNCSVITGCTMAFRGCYLPLVTPMPPPGPLLHDAWISLLLTAIGRPAIVEEKLLSYRHHSAQYTEVHQPDPAARFADMAAHAVQLRYALERLEVFDAKFPSAKLTSNLSILRDKIQHLAHRTHLPPPGPARVFRVVRELVRGRYGRFSNGARSAAFDLAAGLR